MKLLVAYLRSIGICLIIYLDNMFIVAQTRDDLLKWRAIILNLLVNLGFLINYPKSELEPTQMTVFLGFLINTLSMEIKLSQEKVNQAVKEA